MGKTANKQMICEVLMEAAKEDHDIVALCSDSRGSGSFTPFADTYPEQFVETGIAEQNLVSIAAGLAKCGKKSYAVSPACFLSTRSYEQCKVDVAYSNTNVKLIGISGGISYGALGMSHHSAQDIAAMSAIPNMRVYIPSDHLQTRELTKALLKDEKPAYIRVGRNAVDPVYEEENVPFDMDHATVVTEGNPSGNDVAIIACGEMVKPAKDAAEMLKAEGISASVFWICTASNVESGRSDRAYGRKCKSSPYRRRTCTIWRTWFYGGTGDRQRMPEESGKYGAAGCTGHHRNFKRSI